MTRTVADAALPPLDLYVWKTFAEKGTALTGYTAHSVFEDFTFDQSDTMSGAADSLTHSAYDGTDAVVVAEAPSVEAAPLTCAGVTTYKAIKVAHPTPTERIAVWGVGGLGLPGRCGSGPRDGSRRSIDRFVGAGDR